MVPNPANEFQDYIFSPEELRQAQILNPIQLAYLHNLRVNDMRQKISMLAPELPEHDRQYFCKVAELEGRISTITVLINNHFQALQMPPITPTKEAVDSLGKGLPEGEVLADKAARLVDTGGN